MKFKRSRRTDLIWLALGLILLGWLVFSTYRNDWSKAWDAVQRAAHRPDLLAGFFVLNFLTLFGSLMKWHFMSRVVRAPVSLRQSLRLFGTLFLVGTFTPGRAGELAVPFLMRGGGRLTGVALINRVLESSWTLLIGAAVAVLLFARREESSRLWIIAPVVGVFACITLVLSRRRFTEAILGLVRTCLRPFARLGPVAWLLRQEERYALGLDQFYEANERLLRPGPMIVFALLMSAIWVVMVVANWLLAQAFVTEGSKQITFTVIAAVMTVSAITMFISPIPGGVGLSQLTASGVFEFYGYEQQVYLPFLLLAQLELYLVVVAFYFLGRLAGEQLPPPDPADAAAPAGASPPPDSPPGGSS